MDWLFSLFGKSPDNVLECADIKYLGKGEFGSVIKCISKKDNTAYAVKFSAPRLSDDVTQNINICNVDNEKKVGFYLNSALFADPINFIFDDKLGRNNILKYYDLKLEQISMDRIDTSKLTNPIDLDMFKDNTINGQLQNCYVITEYCDNGTLDGFIKEHPEYLSDPELFIDMINQILCGIIFLFNKKIFHWDLKAENILVTSNTDGGYTFKIGDFGTGMTIDKVRESLSNKNIKLETVKPAENALGKNEAGKDIKYGFSNPFEVAMFSGTIIYLPDELFRMATFYRDMYAFVLTIYVLLNGVENHPNINVKDAGESTAQNMQLRELISKKGKIYAYCKTTNTLQAKLLYKIAKIVSDTCDKIRSSDSTKYEYYKRKSNKKIGDTFIYKVREFIIDTDINIYKTMYEQLYKLLNKSRSSHSSSVSSASNNELPSGNASKAINLRISSSLKKSGRLHNQPGIQKYSKKKTP